MIDRLAATSAPAARPPKAAPSASARPPCAPTPGMRNGWWGISARRAAIRSGTVAPTTAPSAERPEPSTLGAPHSATRRATSSCQRPPEGEREVLEVGGAGVGGAHQGEEPAGPRGGRLDEGGHRVAAERRVDRQRVDRRAHEGLGVRPAGDVHVAALGVGDHQQPGLGGRRRPRARRPPSPARRTARRMRAGSSPRRRPARPRRSPGGRRRGRPRLRPARAGGRDRGRARPGWRAPRPRPRAARRSRPRSRRSQEDRPPRGQRKG